MTNHNIRVDKNFTPDRSSELTLISFRMMRYAVGILGLMIAGGVYLLNGLLYGCWEVQESISHYYYTMAGNLFVGTLCAVALFLIAYPGRGNTEDYLANIAGVCALVVAFFPTGYNQISSCGTVEAFHYEGWVSKVHFSFAACFFILLGVVACWQFPKIDVPMAPGPRRSRIIFYRACGGLMILCVLLLAPMAFTDYAQWAEDYAAFLSKNKLVFHLELIALCAFSISWLVKGTESQPGRQGVTLQ